jgi:hypothetical protein
MLKLWHDALNLICIVLKFAVWPLLLWQKENSMLPGFAAYVLKFVKIVDVNAQCMIMITVRDVLKHASGVLRNAARWQLNRLLIVNKNSRSATKVMLLLFL